MQEIGTEEGAGIDDFEDAEIDELEDAETVDLTEVQQQLMEDVERSEPKFDEEPQIMSH